MTWVEVLIVFCGFFLLVGVQSLTPWVRRFSNSLVFGLLFVLLSIWSGVEAFEIIREFM